MMGRALSPFDGQAHIDAVAKGQTAVGPPPVSNFCFLSFLAWRLLKKSYTGHVGASDYAEERQSFMLEAAPPGLHDACTKGSLLMIQVRDALSALEGLTETARLDVMRPLEVLYLALLRP